MDHLCYLCLEIAMLLRLFIAVLLWSPAGKGLTSWLSFVLLIFFCHFPLWYPGSVIVIGYIDS